MLPRRTRRGAEVAERVTITLDSSDSSAHEFRYPNAVYKEGLAGVA